jgi:hypothetical protein
VAVQNAVAASQKRRSMPEIYETDENATAIAALPAAALPEATRITEHEGTSTSFSSPPPPPPPLPSSSLSSSSSSSSSSSQSDSTSSSSSSSSSCVKTQLPNSTGILFRWPDDGSRLEVRPSGIITFYAPDGTSFKMVRKAEPPLHPRGRITQTDTQGRKFDVLLTERCMSRKPVDTKTTRRHLLKRRGGKHPPSSTSAGHPSSTGSIHAPPPPPTHAPPPGDDGNFDDYFEDNADDGNDPFDMHVLRRRFSTVQRRLRQPGNISLPSSVSSSDTLHYHAYHELYDAELAYLHDLDLLKTHYVSPVTLFCEKKGYKNPFVGLPLDRVQRLNVGFLHDIRHAVEHSSRNGTRLMPVAYVLSTFLVPSRLRHYTTFIGMLEVVTARVESLMSSKFAVEEFLDTKAQQMWASYQQSSEDAGSGGEQQGASRGSVGSSQIRSSKNHSSESSHKRPARFSLLSMVQRPQKRIKEYQKLVSRQLKPPHSSRSSAPSGRQLQLLKMIQANLKAAVAARGVSNARDAALAELARREEEQRLSTAKGKITSAISRMFGSSRRRGGGDVKMTANDVRKFNEKKLARSQKSGWKPGK